MKKGFTLLELLIVITILAILAGAMMPMFGQSTSDAKAAKALTDVDSIRTAAVMYHNDADAWPPVGTTGNCLAVSAVGCNATTGWKGPYLAKWEKDPWNSTYAIFNNTTGLYAQSYGANTTNNNCALDDVCVLIKPN